MRGVSEQPARILSIFVLFNTKCKMSLQKLCTLLTYFRPK